MVSQSPTCPQGEDNDPWQGFDASGWLHVNAAWGPRTESPRQIASRWLRLFPRLGEIHPAFREWWDSTVWTSIIPMPLESDDMAERIIWVGAAGNPDFDRTVWGYRLGARSTSREEWGVQYATVDALIGGDADYINRVVSIHSDQGMVPDPDVFNFRSLRAMLLALAEVFDADCGSVEREDLTSLAPNYEAGAAHISPAWLAYVAPRFVPLVTPPPTATVEIRSDGGLLMAATTDTLDISNPAHVRAAFDIAAGCRALRRFGR